MPLSGVWYTFVLVWLLGSSKGLYPWGGTPGFGALEAPFKEAFCGGCRAM